MNRDFERNTKFLTSIRGLACIIVLIAHLTILIPNVGSNTSGTGKIGVWLFFILSAFLLTIQWIDISKISLKEIFKFYNKRIFRVLPCYIVVLFMAFGLKYFVTINDVIEHMLLLKGRGHFWTIPVEMFYYLLVPIIMLTLDRKNYKKSLIVLTIYFCISVVAFPFWKYEENSINLKWYIPVFIMGMILAYIYKLIENKPKKELKYDIIVIAIVIGMICSVPYMRNLLFNIKPDRYLQNKYLFFGLAWSIIILGIFNSKYLYDIFTNSKILKKIGEISFPIYLVHYILLNKLRLSQPILRALAVVVISILLAVILNKLIEQPMIKLSKKINNKFLEEKNGKI